MSLFKLIVKGIKENRVRGILITISVIIAATLFYMSFGISSMLKESFIINNYELNGKSDIIITKEKTSDVFDYEEIKNKCMECSSNIDEVYEEINCTTMYKKDDVVESYNLHGFDKDTLNKLTNSEINLDENFQGYKVIISKAMSDKFSLAKSDTITLSIMGNKCDFRIVNICNSDVFFNENLSNQSVIIPIKTLREVCNIEQGVVNEIHLKVSDKNMISDDVDNIQAKLDGFYVKATSGEQEANEKYKMYITIFLITTIIASILSLYIIYINFKVLIMYKEYFWNLIRCLGASKRKGILILFYETIFYGVCGGILAMIIGSIIQNTVSKKVMGEWQTNNLSVVTMILTLVFAVFISLLGSIVPILNIKDKSIVSTEKFNEDTTSLRKDIIKFIFGVTLIIISIVLVKVMKNTLLIPAVIFGICATLAGVVLIEGLVLKVLMSALERIFKAISCNYGTIAVWQLKGNKYIKSIINLFAIASAIFLIVTLIANSCIGSTKESYEVYNSDGVVYTDDMNDGFVDKILEFSGVDDVYANYEIWNISVEGMNKNIEILDSTSNKHNEFFKYIYEDGGENSLSELDGQRNIVISKVLSDEYEKGVGDKITLKSKNGDFDYKIVGVIDVWINSGRYALISKENMINDFDAKNYDRVYFKVSEDVDEVIKDISYNLSDKEIWIKSTAERINSNLQSNIRIFTLIYAFIVLILVVAMIGIINMLIMKVMQNKKENAVMKIIGMSGRFKNKYLIFEGVIIGAVSSILSIIATKNIGMILPYIYKAIGFPPIYVDFSISQYFIFVFVFMFATSLISFIVSRLMNIRMNSISTIKESIN